MEQKEDGGVGIILRKEYGLRVQAVVSKGERLLMVKINAEPVNIAVVQVYMHTTQHDDKEV